MSSASLYGGTYNQLHYTFPKLGVEVSFIDDPDDLDAWKDAIRPNTRAFYGESIGNPKGDIFDFEGVVGDRARRQDPARHRQHARDARTSLNPLQRGADIVVHSATKFIGGHGTSIGGIIVDGGKFDYVAQRPVRQLHRARPELPRPRVLGAARAAAPGAVHPEGAPAVPARHRRRGLAVQLVPLPPGARDAEPADGASLAERARGREVARGTRRGRVGHVPGARVEPVERRGRRSTCRRARARSSSFGIKGGLEAGQRFIDGLELYQPPRQRRRRAQPRDPPGDHHAPAARRRRSSSRPGSRRTSCASRSASSRSTTSWPTSKPASARAKGALT